MLVLGRHEGEAILIGANVIVRVMEIRGDRVRLGIEAPGEIEVNREEIVDKILASGRKIDPVMPVSGPAGGESPKEMAG
jgi:carbon storage regulator